MKQELKKDKLWGPGIKIDFELSLPEVAIAEGFLKSNAKLSMHM